MRRDHNDETHRDNCSSQDQQNARILRRWLSDPSGSYADGETHARRLRVMLEFFISDVLRRADNPRFHEYWCDGFFRLDFEQTGTAAFKFIGTSIFSNKDANREWLAPFEFYVDYGRSEADIPIHVSLRFGSRENDGDIRRAPLGKPHDRGRIGDEIMASRPTLDSDWAVIVSLDSTKT